MTDVTAQASASASASGADAMQVLEGLLAARYSCRAYKADQVPRAVIERIVRAATVFTDLLDTVIVEQGGEVTNELPLAKEIFDIAQWPDSTS